MSSDFLERQRFVGGDPAFDDVAFLFVQDAQRPGYLLPQYPFLFEFSQTLILVETVVGQAPGANRTA